MTPRELALALAVSTVISDYASDQKDALRSELLLTLNELGADSATAELNGTRVAKSAIVAPSRKAVVSAPATFLAWVVENYPEEVLQSVRDTFQKWVLEKAVEADEDIAVHPETGEMIPGVRFVAKSSYISTRFEKGGREAVVDALRDGRISISSALTLPALEA